MFVTILQIKGQSSNVLHINNIPSDRLRTLLDFLYVGHIEINQEIVFQTLEDAEYVRLAGCLVPFFFIHFTYSFV